MGFRKGKMGTHDPPLLLLQLLLFIDAALLGVHPRGGGGRGTHDPPWDEMWWCQGWSGMRLFREDVGDMVV